MKKLSNTLLVLAMMSAAFAQSNKPTEQQEKPAATTSKADEKKPAQSRTQAPPPQRRTATNVSDVYQGQLSSLEREMVSAAEAMPAEKFDFAPDPKMGEFKGVRTFKQQVGHVAANNFLFASWLTGDKVELSERDRENGPVSLKDKDATVKYLKDSFAAAHKALNTLNSSNLMEQVSVGEGHEMPRVGVANIFLWHGFDHYGQMALYLRMNNIVPPASRPRK